VIVVTSPRSDDEAAVLTELGAALREADEVPDEFVAAALAALTWRTIDAELAELTFDSAADVALATRTRYGASARTLTFGAGEVSVEIEVTEAGIVGQLSPSAGGSVVCQTPAGTFDEAPVDDVGCFVLRTPPSGPVRLRAESAGHAVATSWVCLT
jgi:hypothetical protein